MKYINYVDSITHWITYFIFHQKLFSHLSCFLCFLCLDNRIAFSASYMSSGSAEDLIFSRVLVNYGNGYSSTTGRFTCTVPGLYFFSASLSKTQRVVEYVFCFIKINSQTRVGSIESSTITTAAYSLTITGTFNLNRNDYVNIGTCHGADTLETQDWSSFNGFLISADWFENKKVSKQCSNYTDHIFVLRM